MRSSSKQRSLSSDSDNNEERLNNTQLSIIYKNKVIQNSSEKKNGQTMFQFLKRRKKYTLNQEIENTKINPFIEKQYEKNILEHKSAQASMNQTPKNKNFKNQLEISQIKYKPSQKKSINNQSFYIPEEMNQKSKIKSSKRVTFREEQPFNSDTYRQGQSTFRDNDQIIIESKNNKSFFQIISPFKKIFTSNKKNQSLQKSIKNQSLQKSMYEEDETQISNSKSRSKLKENTNLKQNLNTSIQNLREELDSFVKQGKNYKNKAQGLIFECFEIFKLFLQTSHEKGIIKKIGQLKTNYKIIEKLYSQFQIKNPCESISKIYQYLKEKITSMEAQLKAKTQKQVKQFMNGKVCQYEQKINQLEQQLNTLINESEFKQKKLKKQLTQYKQNQSNRQKNEQQQLRNRRSKIEQLQTKCNQSQNLIKQLNQKIKYFEENQKRLQRQKKTLQYEKLSLVKSFEVQKQSIAVSRQNLLLQQISSLKKTFQVDIVDIKNLYQIKQSQMKQQIEKLEISIKQFDLKSKSYFKSQRNYQEQIIFLKAQTQKFKQENYQLSRKLKESSNQLYLYWTGLKDIKILSTRLGLFNRFMRIYDDIRFCDTTFR